MESRVKETIVRQDKGYNCAQAVACTYCDLFGYKEEDVFRMTEGFGLGMGCMAGTCGALSGAVLLAGLKNSDGQINAPRTKGKTYKLSRQLLERFQAENGQISQVDICGECDPKESTENYKNDQANRRLLDFWKKWLIDVKGRETL